jgi:hypothetical protein
VLPLDLKMCESISSTREWSREMLIWSPMLRAGKVSRSKVRTSNNEEKGGREEMVVGRILRFCVG